VRIRTRKARRVTGTVKWFNSGKGFGFIATMAAAPGVFAHFSSITGGGYKFLEENEKVEFEVPAGPKGPAGGKHRPL
jgi:cold shock protein